MIRANSTGAIFYVNLAPLHFDGAELACQKRGGHLATFTTLKEQQEVEMALVSGGYLKPNFHQFYWTGLKKISGSFQWSDYMFRGVMTAKHYQNWGTYKPGGFKEPYTAGGVAEDCGGSNFTQSVNGVWGWSSAACSASYVSVCRVQRKCTRPPLLRAPLARGCQPPLATHGGT
jgi:hypothetical protein